MFRLLVLSAQAALMLHLAIGCHLHHGLHGFADCQHGPPAGDVAAAHHGCQHHPSAEDEQAATDAMLGATAPSHAGCPADACAIPVVQRTVTAPNALFGLRWQLPLEWETPAGWAHPSLRIAPDRDSLFAAWRRAPQLRAHLHFGVLLI